MPIKMASRVDLVQHRPVLIINGGNHGLNGVRPHERLLGVKLGNVGCSLGEHIDTDVVPVVHFIFIRLLSEPLEEGFGVRWLCKFNKLRWIPVMRHPISGVMLWRLVTLAGSIILSLTIFRLEAVP